MAEKKLELPGWIADHLRRYQESNGADGHLWNGVPCLLLTTTGRKSGSALTLPLIYGRDGDRAVVVASKGGAPKHPAWYANLVAEPRADVQIAADKFSARAHRERRRARAALAGDDEDLARLRRVSGQGGCARDSRRGARGELMRAVLVGTGWRRAGFRDAQAYTGGRRSAQGRVSSSCDATRISTSSRP
jgi:deazaflavin-dependent oxidoreductase (nitroreductase family)